MIDVGEIEKRIDRAIAAPIPVDAEIGGVRLENMGQVMEMAKLMATSGAAVPPWLRANPGGCLAICSRALRWGFDPFAVAEMSYLARGKGGEDHIGFMSQLVHAVITAHAPLKGRLRSEIIGEGDNRRCHVWGTFKGEDKPHEYTSETLGKKLADIGVNDKGKIKGSPLWETEPAVQLTYSAVRQWCRLHSSETLLGVYTPDEIAEEPIDVTPKPLDGLAERLRSAKLARAGKGRGFDPAHVERTGASIIAGEAQEATDEDPKGSESEAGSDKRADASAGSQRADPKPDRRGAVGGGDQADGEKPAGKRTASKENEDLFWEDSKRSRTASASGHPQRLPAKTKKAKE